jgi:hypothetical protein
MSKYIVCLIDPRAEMTRSQMRQLPQKDLCSGSLRLALHLSDLEAESLARNNPDTLGHDDAQLNKQYWADFANSQESKQFRVRV